ncbi:hypothetical protein [Acinetobacter pollinis]|uniref:hypothetical protein n=1 Tax=Acinetobacter pollinis TaxID=2605270 RepID=UPI0018A26A2D|nr:hypothetical protein [Acinetobacter pollinis]MBF7689811.1 hypothetical protein [Acinetobacter pollinis]MBF7697337.1 hypothetical protein [Acinetobacter pollinis]
MTKIVLSLCVLFALSACSSNDNNDSSASDKAPVELSFSTDEAPNEYYPFPYISYLNIESVVDHVSILNVSINRGNCSVSSWIGNTYLKFGRSRQASLLCQDTQVKEVVVDTDQGSYTFNF